MKWPTLYLRGLGLFTIVLPGCHLGYNLHFFPCGSSATRRKRWGYEKSWYNGEIYSFGVGPLLFIAWSE